MNPDESQSRQSPLDHATSARLKKLGAIPMDLSRLDAAILGKIPKSSSGNVIKVRGWLRPMRAAAAIIVITAVAAGLLMVASGGPVVALPSDMAKFHDDMVSGR